MRSVSQEYVAEHLPELIEEIAAGEEIEITAESRPVARLMPPRKSASGPELDDADAPSEEVEQAFYGD